MSDIDFDELDKAVNSLVGDKDEKPQTQSDDMPVKTETTDEKPPVPETPKVEEKTPTTGLPTKRTGKFMDMKQGPSPMSKDASLMNKTETVITPPSGSDIKPTETKDEKSPSSTDMPDPLDHTPTTALEKDDDKKPEEEPKEAEEKTKSGLDFEETEPKKDDDKKTSPFIDDAKVEKRPLGGFSSESPVDPPKKTDEPSDDATKDAQTPAPEVPVELPPELNKDLVAIEAGEDPESIKSPDDLKDEEDSDKDKEDESQPKTDADEKEEETAEETAEKTEQKDHKERVAELLASASSGSIPDQYKRENRSHELAPDKSHPLFDAEHFKNSPAAAAKKPKSKGAKVFQWVFIGLGLLLLGASLGAAIFVFVSQS